MSKIAVLVAAYNAEAWLSKCLGSILEQTLRDVEVVCVDDCSEDNTWTLLQEYARGDTRIKVLRTERNSGQAVARNLALEYVTAPYVCMLDADDWLSTDALAAGLDMFTNYPHTDCVVFQLIKAYDDGRYEDYGLPESLINGQAISGAQAAQMSLDGWRLHGLYITRTELHRQYPFDTSTRLYSDDNTTHLHFLHSREVRACAGRYYYRQHPSLTQTFNSLHFLLIDANLSLRNTLLYEDVDEDVIRTFEGHRWVNFVVLYRTLLKHWEELTAEQRSYQLKHFAALLRTFRHSALPLRACWKPGYWLFHNIKAFDIQQRAYLQYKRHINPSYVTHNLA